MTDEYVYLWAQWGILNFDQYQIVKKQFGNLETAWKKIDRTFLIQLGFGLEKVDRILEMRKGINFHQLIRRIEDLNIRLLCVDDSDYPKCLRAINSPPVFIFKMRPGIS